MATGTLTNLAGSIEISKQTGTIVTFDTDNKFVTGDIALTINAPSANPTFSAAPSGGSTAISSTASISDTTNNSGVSIQTKYSINAATISYSEAASGWIEKSANASTDSSTTAKNSTNGTAYFINGVFFRNK